MVRPRAKRQHFVPRFHLAGFTPRVKTLRDRIWVYDKTTDSIARRGLNDTAVIGNYYTLPAKDGPVDDLERGLAAVEASAASAARHLSVASEGLFALPDDERAAIAGYLGLLHTRVPAIRKGNEALAAFMSYVTLDMEFAMADGFAERARRRGMTGSDEELESFRLRTLEQLRRGDITVEVPEATSLATMKMGLEDIAPILFGMPWTFLRRTRLPFFVMGDCPVTLWPAVDHPPELGVGFLNPGAEVAVPFDPQTLLLARHGGSGGMVVNPDHAPGFDQRQRLDWVFAYNYRQWVTAERFVYARTQADLAVMCMFLDRTKRTQCGISLGLDSVGGQWGEYGRRAIDAVLRVGRG